MKHANTKYLLNERYFEQIDTEEKAYWFGFLAADGCVYQKNGRSQVTLALKGADFSHVAKFATAIGTNKTVTISDTIYKGKAYPRARLTICSKEMANDLISNGVCPQKSLTALPWNGPRNLIRHYWRGVVDGDGWISHINSTARENVFAVGLCGSYHMVRAFSDWIKQEIGLQVEPLVKGKIFSLTFGGTFAAQKVAHLLYHDASVYLNRKYERALALMNMNFVQSKFAPRVDIADSDVIKMYEQLRSIKKVGKHFSLDARTVSRRIKNNGIQLRNSK